MPPIISLFKDSPLEQQTSRLLQTSSAAINAEWDIAFENTNFTLCLVCCGIDAVFMGRKIFFDDRFEAFYNVVEHSSG